MLGWKEEKKKKEKKNEKKKRMAVTSANAMPLIHASVNSHMKFLLLLFVC